MRAFAPRIRDWWAPRRERLLRWAVFLLIADAVVYLGYEFWRLLIDDSRMGAVDLVSRVHETHDWFAGLPVYGRLTAAFYPPATYAILWPFVGWIGTDAARALWAVVTIGALAWLALLCVGGSLARGRYEVAFVALVLIAMYPTGQTIGDGQLIILVLAPLLAALLITSRPQNPWYVDLLAAAFLVIGLLKPTGTAPFLLIPLLAGRVRAVLVAAVAYAGLTVLAASYQPKGFFTLLHRWFTLSRDLSAYHGWRYYADIGAWLGALHLKSWIPPVSLVILVAFALWTWRHRHVDIWLLMAVAALVSRFWTYHQSIDDVLIVVPMVAFYRLAKQRAATRDGDVTAGLLFAATLAVMIVPGGLFLFPRVLRIPFTTLETIVWLCGLAFLLRAAREARLAAQHIPQAASRASLTRRSASSLSSRRTAV